MEAISNMTRMKSKRLKKRLFDKTANKTKKVNLGVSTLRGGRRL